MKLFPNNLFTNPRGWVASMVGTSRRYACWQCVIVAWGGINAYLIHVVWTLGSIHRDTEPLLRFVLLIIGFHMAALLPGILLTGFYGYYRKQRAGEFNSEAQHRVDKCGIADGTVVWVSGKKQVSET